MHRHKWGCWWQEIRDQVMEHNTWNTVYKETYNLRRCETCGIVQETKGSSIF